MKTHVFRLRRGTDLLKALQEYARTRRIAAGTVVSGVGCVTRARVRDASGVTVRELDEPLDDLANRWIAENGLDASHGEELLHCVWTLREELSDDAGPRTVRDFLATHVGGVFSLMTPCGFVPLTAAQAEGLMSGQSAAAHPGVSGITMSLSADELLGQTVNSANYANGVWHLLTEYPEMKQCGPEMGGMQ